MKTMKTTKKSYTLYLLPKNSEVDFLFKNSDDLEYLKRKYRQIFYTGKDLNINYYNYDYIIKDNYNNSFLDFNHKIDSDVNDYYNKRIEYYFNC